MIDTLVEKKFKHVTSIDFSTVLINYMIEKYEKVSDCREYDCKLVLLYVVLALDVCNLSSELPPNSIDVVLDKGCLDCLMTHPKGEEMFVQAVKVKIIII
jgi:hypothetical protein